MDGKLRFLRKRGPARMTPLLTLRSRQFLLPKSDYQIVECEDAAGMDESRLLYAVADGATEAFDSASWAKRLVNSWLQHQSPPLTATGFHQLMREQGRGLHDSWSNLKLSWFAEEKARSGSFAAFVGARFSIKDQGMEWSAIAVGDSCFIHRGTEGLRYAFPVCRPEDFNATPPLVPSLEALQDAAMSKVVTQSGQVQEGDAFFLFSDAVACWYLMLSRNADSKISEFDKLLDEAPDSELADFFNAERGDGRIKDDDIAIIRVTTLRTWN